MFKNLSEGDRAGLKGIFSGFFESKDKSRELPEERVAVPGEFMPHALWFKEVEGRMGALTQLLSSEQVSYPKAGELLRDLNVLRGDVKGKKQDIMNLEVDRTKNKISEEDYKSEQARYRQELNDLLRNLSEIERIASLGFATEIVTEELPGLRLVESRSKSAPGSRESAGRIEKPSQAVNDGGSGADEKAA